MELYDTSSHIPHEVIHTAPRGRFDSAPRERYGYPHMQALANMSFWLISLSYVLFLEVGGQLELSPRAI